MGVFAHKQRAGYPLVSPVFADGLSNGEDMRLGKRRVRTGAAMSACAEVDELVRVGGIGLSFVEGSFEPTDVDQKIFRCGCARVGVCAHREEGVRISETWVNMTRTID